MEWVLRSPQIHSIFSNLGYVHADGYHVDDNCDAALEDILLNILNEDKYLRTYRRSISFGENIKKDLLPLLIHAKKDKTIALLTTILANLTTPIDRLLSVEILSKNDFGRHTIFEIKNLLSSTKNAFADQRATRVVIDFLKKNSDSEQKTKLLPDQSFNVNNSLMLLRNILSIPEDRNIKSPSYSGPSHRVQNQLIWNIFSQSIDKVLIKLMSIHSPGKWGATMVEFIALMYKEQHVVVLHKLLNAWLETTLSESSEDNESNTPPDRGSDDSSPMLTSDPTSDSSDTGVNRNATNSTENGWQSSDNNNSQNESDKPAAANNNTLVDANREHDKAETKVDECDAMTNDNDTMASCTSGINSEQSELLDHKIKRKGEKKTGVSEASDCGYGTQMENQESISTSSNEDDLPSKKSVHQKPHNAKQRQPNNSPTKDSIPCSLQERKRKKMVKRGKSNIINVHGLTHRTPTDDDIANVVKEFTVDFLLKGYNSLVQGLHSDMLKNHNLEVDTSHFFWLVTYFLKFATQIELDLEHLSSVLSFNIVSYLTAEGVSLCEQFELAVKLDGSNKASIIRRLHMVVTAIREFVQAIDEYKKITSQSKEDQDAIVRLQIKMCETEELRQLMLLLIRSYNPKYQSKQYLQDIIVSNHILLIFLDNVMKMPEYNGSASMVDHLRQFANPEIMYQYGVLLEEYSTNGEFVNDCIFTVMHHVGGDLDSLHTMFQPKILKIFSSLCKSDYELCDDWNDLVEYVLNSFTRKPNKFQTAAVSHCATEGCDDEFLKRVATATSQPQVYNQEEAKKRLVERVVDNSAKERWSEDELSSLSWTYLQCKTRPDVIGDIMKLLKEDGIVKSRESVVRELYKQTTINKDEYKKFLRGDDKRSKCDKKDMRDDDISKLCKQLAENDKASCLDWVQSVLLETCHAKIYLEKRKLDESTADTSKLMNFEVFKKKADEIPTISPVSLHSLILEQSVPLVPWNVQQAAIVKDLKFLQLLHKLGFHMPVDSGKVFIRIPHFWTADFLYDVAGKVASIDTSRLKFSVNEFAKTSATKCAQEEPQAFDTNIDAAMLPPENYYQVHKQTHFATMVNFTPMPGCSYNTEASDIDNHNWLKVVQKSQEFKLTLNSGSGAAAGAPFVAEATGTTYTSFVGAPVLGGGPVGCETASVASDLTRMYVSDDDERTDWRRGSRGPDTDTECDADLEPQPSVSNYDTDGESCPRPKKRARVSFAMPI